jgi:two-component system chemotaxis sensor kinase CheA
VGDDDVPISSLAAILGFGENGATGPAVVLEGQAGRHAFRVDSLVGQRPVVVKELSAVVPRLSLVAGASIEPDGSVMLVLDAHGLVQKAGGVRPSAPAVFTGLRRALVVDDTEMMRTMIGGMLETAGYEVVLAADAREAMLRIAEQKPDVILTDVEMPDMDGITLTSTLRSMPALDDVPIAIVTTISDPGARARGEAAGAAVWLVKSEINEQALVDAVGRLLSA